MYMRFFAAVALLKRNNEFVDCSSRDERIKGIVEEPEIGKIYDGKVIKIMDFGAFVNFMGSTDGLVHISQLKNERVEKVEDVISEGDIVKVKVLDIDSRGKIKLSMKAVDAEENA